jgi:Anti-sigma-K factor rskA, C-terminal/Putative zinc-finger
MVHDQAAAFALDALGPDESSEFERHLSVCPACEDGLEPLRFVAAALAFAGELPAPRAQLRLRVLDVGAPVIPLHRRYRAQLLSAAAVAAVCLVLTAVLQPWQATEARGTLVVSPSREAVLVLRHLAPAPAGRAYEAWIVDHGRVTPAGIVRGSVLPLTRRVPAGAAVLVSLEPAGGSPQPTGPVVLKAETA